MYLQVLLALIRIEEREKMLIGFRLEKKIVTLKAMLLKAYIHRFSRSRKGI